METIVHSKNTETEKWFENLIATIKGDYLQLTSGLASQEKQTLYNHLMKDDNRELATITRNQSAKILISELVTDFLKELKTRALKPEKLSLKLSVSEILVWAVIKDNDEKTEDGLLLSEAKINAKYYNLGFHLNTTIVEDSDNINVPSHYQSLTN